MQLAPVAGSIGSFPVLVTGGDLVLTGVVTGPDGPVPDAVVRLERFIGSRSGRLDVRADGSGRWRVPDAHGGRYRLRAWRAPDLAMAASDLRFLAVDDPSVLGLTVERYDGADLTGEVDDPRPAVDAGATVTVLATRQQVDGDGIITTVPASGRDARVEAIGPWRPDGATTAVVDDAGRVSWRFACTDLGSVSATVTALGQELSVFAECVAAVASPVDEEPRPDFPVGATFTPPFAGPIPVGEYAVVDDPGTCGLTYEAWTGTGWGPQRRTVTGTDTFLMDEIARDLQALGDSPPCSYERVS